QISFALGLLEKVEGSHLGAVLGASADFGGAGRAELGVAGLTIDDGSEERCQARPNGSLGEDIIHALESQVRLATIAPRGAGTTGGITEAHAAGLAPLYEYRAGEDAVCGLECAKAARGGGANRA